MQMKKNKVNLAMQGGMFALLAAGAVPQALAQQSSTTGEFRKDNSEPRIYSQEGMVNNFAQQLPLGATFAPLLTAWDVEDGDITARLTQVSGVNTQVPGSYVAQYQVKDDGLPDVDGFKGWGGSTVTFSLPVTVYDPAEGIPARAIPLGELWDEGTVVQTNLYLPIGGSLSRDFRVEAGELPLIGDELTLTAFRLQEGHWGGNNRQFAILVIDNEDDTVVYDGAATFSGGRMIPATPVTIKKARDYSFTLRYLAGADQQGFRKNEAGQLWLVAEGEQRQSLYPYAQVLPDPANKLAYDPGLSRPLKEKLLSSAGGEEVLHVRKLAGGETLSYAIADPALATLQALPAQGQDRLVLSGLAQGETNLEIRAGGELVDLVRLIVTVPKELSLSYSYIAFPGETKTHLWDDGALIQNEIARRYAPYNLSLKWVDNGVLVHEWDKDGDGESYEADRAEREAPFDEGWIPDREQVFSNLYVLRAYKDPARACSGSGGGSSTGMGALDAPPREGHRAACPGNATEFGQAMTLAHELGHNLGLWHMSNTDTNGSGNLMYVGRKEGVFFAPQWRTMHQTLEARIAAGDAGVSEASGEPESPPPATNQPPLANAGGDMRTTGPAELVLDGAASRDPENGALRYQWRQVGGPQASLRDAELARARLSLGTVAQDTQLTFELTVTDEQGLAGVDRVVVTHQAPPPNQPPVLTALAPASVQSGMQVSFTASATDPDGDALSYQWTVPAGLTASGQNGKTLVVTGPNVVASTDYDLTVTVTDGAQDAQGQTRLTVTPASGGECSATDPDAAYWPAWSASTVYNTDTKVSHHQLVWQARYWTQGNEPSQTADQWKLVSQVQLGWHAAVAYSAGELANHKGRKWQARYWTKGNEPGKHDVWLDQGAASCNL